MTGSGTQGGMHAFPPTIPESLAEDALNPVLGGGGGGGGGMSSGLEMGDSGSLDVISF